MRSCSQFQLELALTPVPEQIERSFCNVINSARRWSVPGQPIPINRQSKNYMFFSDIGTTIDYYLDAMKQYGWIERRESKDGSICQEEVVITPEGWHEYGELMKGRDPAKNRAFVAMWFGGKERADEMKSLYETVLRPAVEASGYRVKRADDEHNEPIMDRIIDDIRKAPFLVAEISEQNCGVYYEAGFARGLGKEVIYCMREGCKAHFDVSGINHVRWDTEHQLTAKLSDRIVATLGRGPHEFK